MASCAVIGDFRRLVHHAAYAVPHILPDNGVAVALRIVLYRCANIGDTVAHSGELEALKEALTCDFHELFRLFAYFAAGVGARAVSYEALEGRSHIDGHNVAIADDPLTALSGSESFQQVSEHIFRSAGIAMHAAIECDSLALQSRLLSCGMGIALAAAGEWRQLCEEGSVHLLHIRDAECRRYIYVQQLSRFETHSMRAFRAFLRRYFSEIG